MVYNFRGSFLTPPLHPLCQIFVGHFRPAPFFHKIRQPLLLQILELCFENCISGQVLGLMEDATLTGTNVILEPKDDPGTDHQLWIRSTTTPPTPQGYFTLKNVASGTFLTSRFSEDTGIASMIIAGMVSQ